MARNDNYGDDGLDRAVVCEIHGEAYHPDHHCEACAAENVVCEYDNTPYHPDGDGCPTCVEYQAEQMAEHAWMANAVRGTAGLGTYAEQMQDAGRGHLLEP